MLPDRAANRLQSLPPSGRTALHAPPGSVLRVDARTRSFRAQARPGFFWPLFLADSRLVPLDPASIPANPAEIIEEWFAQACVIRHPVLHRTHSRRIGF